MIENISQLTVADIVKAALIEEIPVLYALRPMRPDRQAAMVVFFFADEAFRSLAPELKEEAYRYGDPSKNEALTGIETNKPVSAIFDHLKRTQQKWSWGSLTLTKPEPRTVVVAAYTGNAPCKRIAFYLTKRGVLATTAY
jgi:hypothetical protein